MLFSAFTKHQRSAAGNGVSIRSSSCEDMYKAAKAYEVAKEVINALRRLGFHISNWMSSDRMVLEKLGEVNLKPSKPIPENDVGFGRELSVA